MGLARGNPKKLNGVTWSQCFKQLPSSGVVQSGEPRPVPVMMNTTSGFMATRRVKMDIVRGSLEEISRAPSSGRTRPGSRTCSAVAGERSRSNGSPAGGALEILSPEPPALKDRTISIEDISDISTDSDTCLNEDIVVQKYNLDPTANADKMLRISPCILETRFGSSTESEEEQEELNTIAFAGKNTSQETQEAADHTVDNRVQKALEKMKKLDKILLRKQERENEVKREGRELLQKLWKELQNGENVSVEEEENTNKYLALIPPTSCAWDDDSFDGAPVTPLFHTQVPFEENNETPTRQCGSSLSKSQSNTTQRHSADGASMRGIYKECKSKTNLQESERNFIRKNIEMVREVGNPIQITEDEKSRLLHLLQDIDESEDLHADSEDKQAVECAVVMAGEGYVPEVNEQHQLEEIDSRLHSILPAEQFALIRSTPRLGCHSFQQEHVLNGDAVGDGPGEKALQDFRETRELQQRLQEIELQLERLQKAEAESELTRLSELDLRLLLSKCPGWEENSSCESTPCGTASPRLPKAMFTKLCHEGQGNISVARHCGEEAPEMNSSGGNLREALSKSERSENMTPRLSEQSEDGVETNDLESSDRECYYMKKALKLKRAKKPFFSQ
ncbi:fibrous sheath-interacting protein 1 isoform X1 [Petromyzon marinus]|uniref:fibrous sheath-interacting protein 1 isoform X1 n=1 Tax=Petromyzon marinus TaxID=7757 RepID=UPI003F72DAB7